jgi:molybdopterin molybdotransferase
VHGVNTRPGKPTILGACEGKAVIGLPGNPVSALVNGYLFVVPVIEKLLGLGAQAMQASVVARLTVNLASQAGREDWWPVKLSPKSSSDPGYLAEPIFGKSNLIFTLVAADGLLRIAPAATGISAGEDVEVFLL